MQMLCHSHVCIMMRQSPRQQSVCEETIQAVYVASRFLLASRLALSEWQFSFLQSFYGVLNYCRQNFFIPTCAFFCANLDGIKACVRKQSRLYMWRRDSSLTRLHNPKNSILTTKNTGVKLSSRSCSFRFYSVPAVRYSGWQSEVEF